MTFGRVPQQPLRFLALALRTTEANMTARFAAQFSKANVHTCQLSCSPSSWSSVRPVLPASDASQLPALRQVGAAPLAAHQEACSALNDDFPLAEFRAALHKLRRKSATGPNGIPNQALLNIPSQSLPWFLAWFDVIWASEGIPPSWK